MLSILLGISYSKTSAFCGDPEQTTQPSPGLNMSQFSYWQKVPPCSNSFFFFMQRAWTAMSQYSPTSIKLKTTVACSTCLTISCQFFKAHICNASTSVLSPTTWFSIKRSFAIVALGLPTSCFVKRIYLFRFDRSTTSLSSIMIFFTPILARPIATPQPNPPVPSTRQIYASTFP